MTHVIAICVDIRGWCAWGNQVAAVPAAVPLVEGLYAACGGVFPHAWRKTLGDGLLLVAEQEAPATAGATLELQQRLVTRMDQVEAAWYQHCLTISQQYGLAVPCPLGWGVSRGAVTYISKRDDYLGQAVSLACRLCGLARPAGVVMDALAFPGDPKGFSPRAWRRTGLTVKGWPAPCPAWVSGEIDETVPG